MKNYFITLTPLESYFFGNEKEFKRGKNDKKENTSYIIRSNPIPQQTTILGMLRKQLLVINPKIYKENIQDYKHEDKENMISLIGKESFDIKRKEAQDFGVIKGISQLFLCKEKAAGKENERKNKNNIYIKTPIDHNPKEKKKYKPFYFGSNEEEDNVNVFVLEGYDAKEELYDGWMNIGNDEIIDADKIFKTDERVGINQLAEEQSEDDYFKTIFYRLEKGFKFGFVATIDTDKKWNTKLEKSIVYMGAKKSAFKLEIQECDKYFFERKGNISKNGKVILLSDTYVEEDIYKECIFGITETIDFRNIRTVYKDENRQFSRTKAKYVFLKRGSVLYSENVDKLLGLINSYKNLQKIGYNRVMKLGGEE